MRAILEMIVICINNKHSMIIIIIIMFIEFCWNLETIIEELQCDESVQQSVFPAT